MLIRVQAIKELKTLCWCVIGGKYFFLALGYQRVSIFILFVVVMIPEVLANAIFAHGAVDCHLFQSNFAFRIFCNLFGVEIWHALPAYETGKYILMSIDHRIETFLSQHLYHLINFFKKSVIIHGLDIVLRTIRRFHLDSFPADAESNEIEAPRF